MTPVYPLERRVPTGRFIALESFDERHHAELLTAAADPETWTYIPVDPDNGFAKRLPWMVAKNEAGRFLIFVVRRLSDSAIVGSPPPQHRPGRCEGRDKQKAGRLS